MQTVFTNAAIVDATAPDPRPRHVLPAMCCPPCAARHVLIGDGIIRDLHARPVGAPDRLALDVRGRTLMPGLIDCHVNVVASLMNLAANAQLPDTTAVLRRLPILRGMLDRGFTTVRDCGGAPFALAEALEQDLAIGPRLIVCGKALSRTGGHADLRPRHDRFDSNRWHTNYGALGRVADGVDEVRRAARQDGAARRRRPRGGRRSAGGRGQSAQSLKINRT
jgi:imidazolonepropionase-like amidohydrolase